MRQDRPEGITAHDAEVMRGQTDVAIADAEKTLVRLTNPFEGMPGEPHAPTEYDIMKHRTCHGFPRFNFHEHCDLKSLDLLLGECCQYVRRHTAITYLGGRVLEYKMQMFVFL